MKTTYTDIKINSKISSDDYDKLQAVCQDYGLNSPYQVLQILVEVLVRHVDPNRDAEQETGIPVELTEIVRKGLEDFKKNGKKKKSR